MANAPDAGQLKTSHAEYLKWTAGQLISRIDASEGHVETVRQRAMVAMAAAVGLAAWVFTYLGSPSLSQAACVLVALVEPFSHWWAVLKADRTLGWDPEAYWNAESSQFEADLLHEALTIHLVQVANEAQKRTSRLGIGLKKLQIAISYSIGAQALIAASKSVQPENTTQHLVLLGIIGVVVIVGICHARRVDAIAKSEEHHAGPGGDSDA